MKFSFLFDNPFQEPNRIQVNSATPLLSAFGRSPELIKDNEP